jgi:heat shock protein HslJ
MRRFAAMAVLLVAVATLAGACSASNPLTGKVWVWVGSTTTQPASQSTVPNPRSYTIEFASGGTFAAKADCNQVNGSYVLTDPNGLTITPGPSTQAACGPGSLGSVFIAGLSTSKTYEIKDQQLIITNVTGTMTFR